MKQSPPSLLFLILLLAAAGCGERAYEQRFDETRKYFAYLERLNQFLSRTAWSGAGLQIRVPKQFQPISPPPAPKEGEDSTPTPDPRQPPFLEAPLPGLQGAWQADLQLSGDGGRGRAYLYVLSNYDLLAKKESGEEAAAFNDDILKRLATASGEQAPAVDKLSLFEVPKGPKSESYVEKLSYRTLNPALPMTYQEKPYRIEIYTYQKPKSPAQVCIVLAAPDNVSPNEKMDRAMTLSLETLQVIRDRPVPAPAGGAPEKGSKPSGI